ncbi:hypothetical protein L596_029165 [Steinernema carpocapsae]|uniref:Major facilitator superfamily (MFS) profile domain-containing protein n=1 Tax=Steinernema carpocapsae TaxID=34508 RepID=A0A4V5ZXG1_STECR|nr:hypothetical protein L596_029165 [Steinernema carpocapsae]
MIRFLILLIACLGLTLLFANGAIFHFTVICMDRKHFENENPVSSNVTIKHDNSFSSYEESVLFGALAMGCIIGNYPTVKLFDLYGFRSTFTGFGILSAVGTIVVPLLGHSFYVILADRLIQGFALAASFLAFGIVPNDIALDKEKSLFVSLLSCSLQLGPCLIMPISGLLCSSSLGWEGAYYLSGGLTILIFLIFYFTYRTTANSEQNAVSNLTHDKISPQNIQPQNAVVKQQISDCDSVSSKDEVPYKSILTCPSVWGIMVIAFGDTIGFTVFLLYGPIYINKALGFDVTETGLLSALPYIISIVTKAFGGVFLDRASCIKERLRVLLFTSISQGAMTLCFLVLTQISADMAIIGQSMLTLMMVFSGLAFIGLMSGTQIISQQYGYVVTSALAIQDSLAGLLVPALVALAAPNYDKEEWRMVFYILVVLLSATNVIFVVLTKVKPAVWTNRQLK